MLLGVGPWNVDSSCAKLREARALPWVCWHEPEHPQSFRRHVGMVEFEGIRKSWKSSLPFFPLITCGCLV